MKKRSRWFFLILFVGLALVGCQAAATPTLSPLEWLHSQPFEPAPYEWPQVVTSGLPEGFALEDSDIYSSIEGLADDEYHQVTEITYTNAAGDGVRVNILAFSSAETRSDFLNTLPEYVEEDELSFEKLSHGQVVRAQFDEFDSRIWVHGPYLILVGSDSERAGPWVNDFADLYLARPPSPGRDISEQPSVEYPEEVRPPDLPGEQPSVEYPEEVGPPDLPGERPIEFDILGWLREQPFEPAPPGWPEVVTNGFPEGFEFYIDDVTEELPGGETVQITQVSYDWPLGGRGLAVNSISVGIVGSQSAEARSELFETMAYDMLLYEDYTWSIEPFGNVQVVRFLGYEMDGRIWISGPYLILVMGGGEKRSPWVDTFVELYMTQPPTPGTAVTLIDWLDSKPFEPAPSGWPNVILSDLPQGFEADGPESWSDQLPSGETGQMTIVRYSLAAEDWIGVVFYAFGSATGRTEFLSLQADEYNLSPEPREWYLEQIGGGEVAFYGTNGWDQGTVWISGPYLIVLESQVREPGLWMETFAEMYLSQYPAE